MAMTAYGPFVLDVRKKIGNVVFTKGHSASVIRKRVRPRNPRTSTQLSQRSSLSTFSKSWGSTLTQTERNGWDALAATVTIKDRLGNAHHPTGLQLFERVNLNLKTIAVAELDAPPADQNVTALTSITPAAAAGAATFTVAYTATPAAAATVVVIYASPQNSPGRQSTFGAVAFIQKTAAAAASPANIEAAYVAKWGALIAGKKIRVRALTINNSNGAASIPLISDIIVAA